MPLTSITELDLQAARFKYQQPDPSIMEFDLTLWHLLKTLCQKAPEHAMKQFNLTRDGVQALSDASDEQLLELSSGVLISFRLETSESVILDLLEKPYTPVILMSDSSTEFDSAYWLLLKNTASRDYQVAATCFGVTSDLTLSLTNCTDNQIRHLANNTVTAFSMRFDPKIIPALLNPKIPNKFILYCQKYQQAMSLSHRGKRV